MDLGAYVQINDLESIVEKNEIVIPRLRGYRLMKDEEKITDYFTKEDEYDIAKDLLTVEPIWSINSYCHSHRRITDLYQAYYLDEKNHEIKWNRIHGKHRKALKFAIKSQKRRYAKQFETFNKYVGRDDVLMIHARIGGDNWAYYGGASIQKQPWFIEKVDDAFDCTYCDIYAHIQK